MKCQQETNHTMKKIPKQLEWNNTIYDFKCNKGNTICYVSNPSDSWGCNGKVIIVEYRPNKRPKDSFYVLYSIDSYVSFMEQSIMSVNRIKQDRMAIPIWE